MVCLMSTYLMSSESMGGNGENTGLRIEDVFHLSLLSLVYLVPILPAFSLTQEV